MLPMTRRDFMRLVLASSAVLPMAGCSVRLPFGGIADDPNRPDPSTQSVGIALGKMPLDLDPATVTSADDITVACHLFSGLAKWHLDEGVFSIVPDCAVALPEPIAGADGTWTYSYDIRGDATWSDGTPVRAEDFAWSWRRIAGRLTGQDYAYRYLLSDIVGFSQDGYDGGHGEGIAVRAVGDRTLEVTLSSPIPYWNELLAHPILFPARRDLIEGDPIWGQREGSRMISNGAYCVEEWKPTKKLRMRRRQEYHRSDEVTMGRITVESSGTGTDVERMFDTGAWKVIMAMPAGVSREMRQTHAQQYRVAPQLGTYYLAWNTGLRLVPDGLALVGAAYERAQATVRRALSLLIDRQAIVSLLAVGQVAASSLVPPGMRDVGGMEFYALAGGNDGYAGYFDVSSEAHPAAIEEAKAALSTIFEMDENGMFVGLPTIRLLTSYEASLGQIATEIIETFHSIGMDAVIDIRPHDDMMRAIDEGDFDVVTSGWIADHTDPMSFLELWLPTAIDTCQLGRGAHAGARAYSMDLTAVGYEMSVRSGTWDETYVRAISLAKAEPDQTRRFALLHKAEDLLMTTGAICPLYYYAQAYLSADDLMGFSVSPLGTVMMSGATVGT